MAQVARAIDLGRRGQDLSVHLGAVNSRDTACTVNIDGPMARIVNAVRTATREYKPFTVDNVAAPMRAQTYTVSIRAARGRCFARHIVLQPVGAELEGVVQPLKEDGEHAEFDRLPDDEFNVIIVLTSGETPRAPVSARDRANLLTAAGLAPAVARSASLAAPTAEPRVPIPDGTSHGLRLVIHSEAKHAAEAITALRAALDEAKVQTTVVQSGDAYDYLIVVAEGDRQAATAIAVTAHGDVAAVAVRAGFTEKGAAEAAGRDLAKKLVAVAR